MCYHWLQRHTAATKAANTSSRVSAVCCPLTDPSWWLFVSLPVCTLKAPRKHRILHVKNPRCGRWNTAPTDSAATSVCLILCLSFSSCKWEKKCLLKHVWGGGNASTGSIKAIYQNYYWSVTFPVSSWSQVLDTCHLPS